MSGGQLVLDVPDVVMADIDVEAADAEMERLLEDVVAAATWPRPCRCEGGALVLDDGDGEPRCVRCGRGLP